MFDLIGKTVGPYRILEQAGAGGMATVYKAYQPNMDRYIAVKILPLHLSNDPEFAKRFQREARAIARLEHAHILPVYDYGEYEGITYITMRYIKAGTLKDRMSAGRLSLDEINNVISQIGSALDYAHRMGVIHRDIKPGNVLMDEQGDVYLSDFGLARMMEQSQQLTGSGVGLGTPAYMSPEQGQGNKIDHRTDIYALGIILYEMLTGRVPYEAETPMAVVFKHINGDLPLPHTINPDTPEPVERVILKALAKDPADRYQTVGEMVQALNFAVRMMSAGAEQNTIADKIAPVQQDVSIVTKIQRLWDKPRGKMMLASGSLATVLLLGFLLIQLPGNITILAPNATDQSTAVPVTTTTQSVTTVSESSTQSINGLYDDFNNPAYDGTFDKTKWAITEDYKGSCNVIQQNGYLTITHTPSSSLSGCDIQGNFNGIAGNRFQSFEAKIFISNDFQGTCCGYLGMTLASSSFSGGGGWIECSLQPQAGTIAGVFAIKHGQGESEFWRQTETTFNSWHTLSLQIDQTSYTVSCYLDDKLIGSVIPKDAEILKNGNFQRYLSAGWPENSTGTYQLDDVSVSEIQPTTTQIPQSVSALTPADYGSLLYEDTFDSDTGVWSLEKGNSIQGGEILLSPGSATFPFWKTQYSNYIFETEFRFINPEAVSGFSVYLRYHECPGETRNCSDQVGVSSNGEVAAWAPNGTRNYERLLAPTDASLYNKNSSNKLTVMVNGSEFRVFINNAFVRSFTDSSYESGTIIVDTDGTTTALNYVRIYAIPSVSNVSSLPTPQGKLVFDQNFDSGLATGIVPFDSTKWVLTDDSKAGKVFQLDSTGSGWMGFRLGTMTVADGTIEFKVKLVHLGVVTCDFRSGLSESFGYLFALHVDQGVVDLNYFGADTEWHLLSDASAVPFAFTENVWYDAKIDFQGNRITAYLDGKQLLTTSDDQLKSGIITFGVGPNTVAQFDDIRVWAQP